MTPGVQMAIPELTTSADLTAAAYRLARRLGWSGSLDARWNDRLRTTAGRTIWFDSGHVRLELNPRLLRARPREAWVTLAHEVCHAVAGRAEGHGRAWRRCMEALGLEPQRTHSLDVSALRLRRRSWLWNCDRCLARYVRRHRAVHRYRCRCGGALYLAGEVR